MIDIVKASDTAGNEATKCGLIVVEAKLLGITLPPMIKPESKAPAAQDPQPDPLSQKGDGTGPILPLIFGGNKSAPQSASSAPQPVTQFSAPSTKSAVPPLTPQQQGNILWGAAAAASVGAWTAETQRKKKEKEEAARAARAAETVGRSKAYSQIAKAYSASKAAFREAVKNAQSLGMSKTEADQLLKDVNTTGTIGGALSTVESRTKQLEAKRRAAEQRMQQQEMREEMEWQQVEARRQAEAAQKRFDDWLRTGKNPPPGFEDVSPQERADMYKESPEYQARQQALKDAQQAALREQSQQDFRAGERAGGDKEKVDAYLAQNPPKDKPWWEKMGDNFKKTVTSGPEWIKKGIQAIPEIKTAALLAPIKIKATRTGNYLFNVNNKLLNGLSSLTSKIGITIPTGETSFKKWLLEKTGFNTLREKGTTIVKDELLDRIKKGVTSEWIDLKSKVTSFFTKKATKEVAGEIAEETLEVAAKEATESAAKSGFSKLFKAITPGVFDALVDTGFNIYDYAWGSKKNETDKVQKVIVDSGVDITGSLLTGLAAAGAAALVVAGVAAAGVTAPLWAAVGLTVVIGIGLDIGLEALGVKTPIKKWINNQVDTVQTAFSSPTPAQPPVPAPTAPISQSTPTVTPSAPSSGTPTATPNP